MGMFDYVRCEAPLPDGKPDTEFQTKDFPEPYMETYTITSAGRLVHRAMRYEFVPEEERPYWGKPEWLREDGTPSLFQMAGMMRGIPTGDVDMNWHGWLNFYGDDREFNAKFTDGQLVAINLVLP